MVERIGQQLPRSVVGGADQGDLPAEQLPETGVLSASRRQCRGHGIRRSKAAGSLLAVRRAHRPGHRAAPGGGTYRHEAGERTHGNASGAGPANRRCERSHPSASSCRARPAPTGRGCAALAGIATDLDASAPPIDRDEEWHCPGLRPAHSRAVAPLGGNSGLRALWAWCRSWVNATKKNRKTHSVDAQPERALKPRTAF
ncbi:Uncharacterised protein [Pseudomonas aeruginosa]|nr:Uncharacterised protein [Pseudomonas aeruginosa]